MGPIVHIQLSGKTIFTILTILAAAVGLVWLTYGATPAIAAALIGILLIKGSMALFSR